MIFQKQCTNLMNTHNFYLDNTKLQQTKNYTYLGLNITYTGNTNMAVKDLRDKARRAFCAIKRNIKTNIPIRIWLKIFQFVIEPILLYGSEIWGPKLNQNFDKWDKTVIESFHTEFCKNILQVQRKTPNNACRAELGQYPLILKIQKRSIKFYNHLKSSHPQTYHHKALSCPEKSPLGRLVLRLSADQNTNPIRPNQMINHQKEKYITYWKETTKTQSKLQCYLALKREYTLANYLSTIQSASVRKVLAMYRLSGHSLAIETGRHRQNWLPEEDRLCSQCDRGQVETELHFLTSCPKYQTLRNKYFTHITQTCPEFEFKTDTEKLPYLLGEIPKCLTTAAKFICCCNELRTTSGH